VVVLKWRLLVVDRCPRNAVADVHHAKSWPPLTPELVGSLGHELAEKAG
jgi:hypothetical protein